MTAAAIKDPRVARAMPRQKPGESKQDYETPADFLDALERRFGPIGLDLAATPANAKAPHFITPEQDSLGAACDWDAQAEALAELGEPALAFLNPPFGRIEPWVQKCAAARRLRILFLVPASVGSNWWAESVHGPADRVLLLRPRLEFDGLPCARRRGKERTCLHDADAHAPGGGCTLCDCEGYRKDPYPKDCAVVVYNEFVSKADIGPTIYECWDWSRA